MQRKLIQPVVLIVVLQSLVGCSGDPGGPGGGGAAPQGPPAIAVEVATAVTEPMVDYREFTGRTTAIDAVEIRPRVSGYIVQTPLAGDPSGEEISSASSLPGGGAFHPVVAPERPDRESTTDIQLDDDGQKQIDEAGKNPPKDADSPAGPFVVLASEGDLVQQGDPLFEIDPEPYQLAYRQAAGTVEAARAELIQARQELKRQQDLIAKNATTRSSFDNAVAGVAGAAGRIENLNAVADRAYLDWKYTQVRSPITGLLGRSLMTRGNLAVADSTILTTVVTTDPIFVYFDVDENSVLDYRSRIQQGEVKSARNSRIDVEMALANETTFPHHGTIDFVDNTTDPNTGNTRIRARFDNPDGALSPGLFARVRAPFSASYQAVLVPTIAIGADQQGRYVMVVDGNEAQRRPVITGTQRGDLTVIGQGIGEGERVIVSGLQRVRNGSAVTISSASATEKPALNETSKEEQIAEPSGAPTGQTVEENSATPNAPSPTATDNPGPESDR